MNALTGRSKSYFIGVLVAYTAVVLAQAMYFKFTNSVETQLVFGTLSDWLAQGQLAQFAPVVRSYGHFLVANLELVAAFLLLLPPTRAVGALLAMCVASGAVLAHMFTPLGVSVVIDRAGATDGGILFGLALGTWFASGLIILLDPLPSRARAQVTPHATKSSLKTAAAQQAPKEDLENLDRLVAFDAADVTQLEESFDQLLFNVKRVFRDEIVGEHRLVLRDCVQSLDSLPSQSKYFPRRPLIIPKLIRAVNNVASSKMDLVAVISHDPVLAGELLKVANSPYYRLSDEPVDSIGRAIVVLGMDGLKSMASTLVMQPVLQVRTSYFPRFSETVWLHSVKAALAAQAYARKTSACDSFQAHLLCLLSSIGHIVVFQMMMEIYTKYSVTRPQIEVLRSLRNDHADSVSAAVVDQWHLSDEFVEILNAYQLKTPVNELEPLGRALYYGRLVATAHMLFEGGRYTQEQIDEIMKARGLHPEVFQVMWGVLSKDKASMTAGTLVSKPAPAQRKTA